MANGRLLAFLAVLCFGSVLADYASCVIWGDPHYTTFDGIAYTFMDVGSHYLVLAGDVVIWSHAYDCYNPDIDGMNTAWGKRSIPTETEVRKRKAEEAAEADRNGESEWGGGGWGGNGGGNGGLSEHPTCMEYIVIQYGGKALRLSATGQLWSADDYSLNWVDRSFRDDYTTLTDLMPDATITVTASDVNNRYGFGNGYTVRLYNPANNLDMRIDSSQWFFQIAVNRDLYRNRVAGTCGYMDDYPPNDIIKPDCTVVEGVNSMQEDLSGIYDGLLTPFFDSWQMNPGDDITPYVNWVQNHCPVPPIGPVPVPPATPAPVPQDNGAAAAISGTAASSGPASSGPAAVSSGPASSGYTAGIATSGANSGPASTGVTSGDNGGTVSTGTSGTNGPFTEPPATPAPVTDPPATPAPVTDPPATPAPVTDPPATPAPVTDPPATPAPVTDPPATPAPVTPAPVTPAPVTPAPVTPAPVTPAPVTPAPVTPAPVTPAPVTPAPVTEPPTTPAPVTDPPATPAPVTAPPTPDPNTPPPVTEPPVTPAPATAPPATPAPTSTPAPVPQTPAPVPTRNPSVDNCDIKYVNKMQEEAARVECENAGIYDALLCACKRKFVDTAQNYTGDFSLKFYCINGNTGTFVNASYGEDVVRHCQNAIPDQTSYAYCSCIYDHNRGGVDLVQPSGNAYYVQCSKTSSACYSATACPDSCHYNGKCIDGKCQCNDGWAGDSCGTKGLTKAAKIGIITAGVLAGIIIAAVAFVALSGYGGVKGYLYLKENKIGGAHNNPLYNEKPQHTNPFYANK